MKQYQYRIIGSSIIGEVTARNRLGVIKAVTKQFGPNVKLEIWEKIW